MAETKLLVVVQKGNQTKKVLEEFVPDFLQAGWKKVVVKKGKRGKDDKLLKGEVDSVELVGIDEPDVKELKDQITKLKAAIVALKADNKALKDAKVPAK